MSQESELRRTERVAIELPIEVSGTDATGRTFVEAGRTVTVSLFGAKIVIPTILVPDQEVYIRSVNSGEESLARVVGALGQGAEGTFYGVTLIGDASKLWGIEFPPIAAGNHAVGRVLLECVRCATREVVYLDAFELEVLEANASLNRPCKRCTDNSLWKKSFAEDPATLPEPAATASDAERRREPRRDMRVQACVRSVVYGDDLVMTVNISRNGLCFKSPRAYGKGGRIEIAVPFSKGGGNIFVPAQIARSHRLQGDDAILYGAFYVHRPPES